MRGRFTRDPLQPMQHIAHDKRGVLRFRENKIVRYLLEAGPFDLAYLDTLDFPRADREQFAQLIGYPVSGFGELSYVRRELAAMVEGYAEGVAQDRKLRRAGKIYVRKGRA